MGKITTMVHFKWILKLVFVMSIHFLVYPTHSLQKKHFEWEIFTLMMKLKLISWWSLITDHYSSSQYCSVQSLLIPYRILRKTSTNNRYLFLFSRWTYFKGWEPFCGDKLFFFTVHTIFLKPKKFRYYGSFVTHYYEMKLKESFVEYIWNI